MKIQPTDREAVRAAREFVKDMGARGKNKELKPAFFGHALLIEAMAQLLSCDYARAESMADGLMVLALADQHTYLEKGESNPIGKMLETAIDPLAVARIRSTSGIFPGRE